MKKIVALSLIAAASLSVAACKKEAPAVANDTNVTENTADVVADTNTVDTNEAVAADNASNAM